MYNAHFQVPETVLATAVVKSNLCIGLDVANSMEWKKVDILVF